MGELLFKRGDTRKGLRAILKTDGVPVDLTDCQVLFYMGLVGQPAKVIKEVEIKDAEAGEVWVVWAPQDVDTAGTFRAEFEVVYGDGRKETFPDLDYVILKIIKDVGGS